MTKQEMIDQLVRKAADLSDDDILELVFLADKMAQDIVLDD